MTGEHSIKPSPDGRYEVTLLFGPCSAADAEEFAVEIAAVYAGRHGAVVHLSHAYDSTDEDPRG